MRLQALRLHAPPYRVVAIAFAAFFLAVLLLGRVASRRGATSVEAIRTSAVFPRGAADSSAARSYAMPAPRAPQAPPMLLSRATEGIVTVDADAAAPEVQIPGSLAAAPDAPTSMVIRTGTASVQVDSLELAMGRVRALAAQVGGFVADASLAAGREQVPSATLEIKVPAARFDELLTALRPVGRVETVNVSVEDVGEEFVDVAAREANARRLEERLVALLATRTGKLADVVAVEHELARVREEIERYDGRTRWLKAHAAMSTLTVTVHESPPVLGPSPVANPVAEAFRQAWRNCVGVVAWLVAASGVIVPVGILALIGWPFVARWRRA